VLRPEQSEPSGDLGFGNSIAFELGGIFFKNLLIRQRPVVLLLYFVRKNSSIFVVKLVLRLLTDLSDWSPESVFSHPVHLLLFTLKTRYSPKTRPKTGSGRENAPIYTRIAAVAAVQGEFWWLNKGFYVGFRWETLCNEILEALKRPFLSRSGSSRAEAYGAQARRPNRNFRVGALIYRMPGLNLVVPGNKIPECSLRCTPS
jgi:hypothetical protein